ncbi:DUF3467 domain-containing protein [Methylocystis sp.]|uniref:DUF3467 domain-containing protein n=1 Tax=Methylocystis sp. TaxID=1911079 RepID=UPI003D113B07
MKATVPPPPGVRVPTITKSINLVDIYSNNIRTIVSQFDIGIMFSRTAEIAPGAPTLEEQAFVRMSPEHFKYTIDYLTKTLEAWEEVFGPINAPLNAQDKNKILAGFRMLKDRLAKPT